MPHSDAGLVPIEEFQMLTPPDPERQYVAMLSPLVEQGNTLIAYYDRRASSIWNMKNHEQAQASEVALKGWISNAHSVLHSPHNAEFETLLDDGKTPGWTDLWNAVTGRTTSHWSDVNEIAWIADERILARFVRLVDYLKALRLRNVPSSSLSLDFYEQFAEQFHRMGESTIDALFIQSGCVLHYWIPPYKPQIKQSAERVYGWLDGLNLYMPDALITMVETVYQAYRDYKQFPRHLPPDHIQVALHTLKTTTSTATPTSESRPFAAYHFHPRVVERATPFWTIQEYDTALLHVCIELDRAVQAKSAINDHGTALMRMAFSPKKPRILIDPRFGNQQGFMDLFAGVMDAIRNPRAHHHTSKLDKDEALEWLAFLSALFRVLDATTINNPDETEQRAT